LLDLEIELSFSFSDGQLLLLLLKPGVQLVGAPATGPAAEGQTYTQTSLVANPMPEDSHWDVKHNVTAKAFTPGEAAPGFRSVAAPVTKPGGPTPRGPPQLQVSARQRLMAHLNLSQFEGLLALHQANHGGFPSD